MSKRNKKKDRFDKEPVNKMNKVRKAFKKIALLNKKRIVLIPNHLPKAVVQANIQKQLLRFLDK